MAEPQRRPKVLIVEPDPDLALAVVEECLSLGLEPKLCRGPENASWCPGATGEECPRNEGVEASLIAATSAKARAVAPVCAAGRVLVTDGEPLLTIAVHRGLPVDATIPYPYEPAKAATLLFAMVRDARRAELWDRVRTSPGAVT